MGGNLPRIGLLGGGMIAQHVWRRCRETQQAKVEWVWMRRPEAWPSGEGGDQPKVVSSIEEALGQPVDLIVEAAHPDVVKRYGVQCLEIADFMVLSLTALADERAEDQLNGAARKFQKRLIAPHGAVLGLDGIVDARDLLQEVTITTEKHPASLGNASASGGLLYQGSTREACKQFPRNVNVHAAVALAGIGFDRTVSRIMANPELKVNRHVIEVKAEGVTFKIESASTSNGKLTGAYTPESTFASVVRACSSATEGLVIF